MPSAMPSVMMMIGAVSEIGSSWMPRYPATPRAVNTEKEYHEEGRLAEAAPEDRAVPHRVPAAEESTSVADRLIELAFARLDPMALGVAIGNIASHEAGHILGLNHVDDPTALMDAVSPADTFLQNQDFKTAPLSEQILPIGFQDALLLLAEIVGLR